MFDISDLTVSNNSVYVVLVGHGAN